MRIFRDGLATFTHWFAWTLSVIASVFFLYFIIKEAIPDLLHGRNIEEIKYFTPLLVIAIIGCFISFFRLKTGAVLMLIGGIGMVVYFYVKSGMHDFGLMFVYGLPYLLPAFLFLIVPKKS